MHDRMVTELGRLILFVDKADHPKVYEKRRRAKLQPLARSKAQTRRP